jgi:hypothetical protein
MMFVQAKNRQYSPRPHERFDAHPYPRVPSTSVHSWPAGQVDDEHPAQTPL